MRYNFSDITNKELYGRSVLFVLGKHNLFINMVTDKVKELCTNDNLSVTDSISGEFGLDNSDDITSTSVDFNTFMEVNSVPNINGKWYCKVDITSLTKKQKDRMLKYIKAPSKNGVLVLVSNDWIVYREYLNNRFIASSRDIALIQLTFPHRDTLKILVKKMFKRKGMEINTGAIEMFIIKMSTAYDEYEQVIDTIKEQHSSSEEIEPKQLKVYMKGIEHFDIDDFIVELLKPMSSGKVDGRKKVVRVMAVLQDELGARKLLYSVLNKINEMIEYRILINSGIIPVGIKYFFGDVIKDLGGEKGKYGKVNEWTFRKKAELASRTSLRDWEYMRIILSRAIENKIGTESEIELRCQKALYELCTRSVLTESRINNIIGASNILEKGIDDINRVRYTEEVQ